MSDFTQLQLDSNEIGYYELPKMYEKLEACWSFGPLEVCAELIATDRIDVSVKLAGVKIGSGRITANDNKLCVGANVGLVKVSICITADFKNQTVWVDGKLCNRKWDFSWHCNTFKAKLISW